MELGLIHILKESHWDPRKEYSGGKQDTNQEGCCNNSNERGCRLRGGEKWSDSQYIWKMHLSDSL